MVPPSPGRVTGSAKALVESLVRLGPQSRRDLGDRLDLSRASLSRLATPLLDSGLLIELDTQHQAPTGRPAMLLDVVADQHHFVGLHVTAHRLQAVQTDLRGNITGQSDTDVRSRAPGDLADRIVELVRALPDAGHVQAVGISLAAHVPDLATVEFAEFLGWDAPVPLADMVREGLGAPTVVDNDLLARVRAELWFGLGTRFDHFAVVTIGAGVGYGLVVHARVVAHEDFGFGVIGHHPIRADGRPCRLGHRGCATAQLASAHLERALYEATGDRLTVAQGIERAARGDDACRALMRETAWSAGRLLSAIATIAMPEAILLAGEDLPVVEPAVDSMWEGFSHDRNPRMAQPVIELGEAGPIQFARGGAVAAIEHHLDTNLAAKPPPTP